MLTKFKKKRSNKLKVHLMIIFTFLDFYLTPIDMIRRYFFVFYMLCVVNKNVNTLHIEKITVNESISKSWDMRSTLNEERLINNDTNPIETDKTLMDVAQEEANRLAILKMLRSHLLS